ncbi:MAG: NAD(P)-dependent glycerol-1-phosphate dehydrogenase [Thermoplasmata archaeon]|nr:NAD(P)-dependent glycerol-1-phosphate dehydrogenase [Thermoplasmata archaeon]
MCREFQLEGTALVVTGPATRVVAGQLVADMLIDAAYDVDIIEVGPADEEAVAQAKSRAIEVDAEYLVGVGGGSKIDVAKLAAFQTGCPFISVPTSAAHDGIASPRASIRGGESSENLSFTASVPMGVVADTSIIIKSPWRLLEAGCADVISNITAVMDWELAHRLKHEDYSTSAATLSKMVATVIIENASHIKPTLEESAWIMIKPVLVSGVSMSIAGTSRPSSGSEHMFSHALDHIAPSRALHGEQCGVGTILSMALHGGDWQRIRDALDTIGCPTTAKGLNVSKDELIQAMTTAHTIRDRYTILGESGITEKAAERIAVMTKVL